MLDEIGELPLTTQAKLLRVLQEQQLQRVGAPLTRKLDVRVIAVTNRDLRRMVAEKTFREDLYYRLSMIEIRNPPLQQRKEDISLLERHFVRHFAAQYGKTIRGLTRRAQTMLSHYSWPGNVREMENILGHACLMAQGEIIDVHDFPEAMRQSCEASVLGPSREKPLTLEENQRRYVREIVERVGNKVQAADILGISRTTLYRLLENKGATEMEDAARHHH
jgi:transcriptional regulator with PAS, ATPase and Fis domain